MTAAPQLSPAPPAPPSSEPLTAAPASAPRRLQLVVVRTPGPPLQEEGLPVRLLVPGRRTPRPTPPPGPRPRLDRPARPAGDAADFGPAWTRRAELPDPQAVGRRLVTLTLEAFAGRRPISQLQSLVSPALFQALSGRRRPRWCTEGTAPLLLSSVRVCEPVDGVAEISAVARRGGRAHAVAARLEGVDGRWRCTALQVG
ncbi:MULTISPECIES: Rv3235 family protein [unclassified Modestobacter]|uniref:Rv3235 family protein n=1 Tax=unclassified Modestobacter TaxID=2643866 RepID=UPI0022AB016E|nr:MULTISPECIES: Rv3235 family protein [unclassified Modestobacter]MCZ2823818.1 Rv3235 family protein [Modestobacter sp. VKM Ac-2981]MCZ2852063.1 Rv3235 family protein [Modestobacter sp. VKM Ac-2982]